MANSQFNDFGMIPEESTSDPNIPFFSMEISPDLMQVLLAPPTSRIKHLLTSDEIVIDEIEQHTENLLARQKEINQQEDQLISQLFHETDLFASRLRMANYLTNLKS